MQLEATRRALFANNSGRLVLCGPHPKLLNEAAPHAHFSTPQAFSPPKFEYGRALLLFSNMLRVA